MKVRGIADFFGAVFEGTVLFIGTDIGSDFFAADAKFQNNGFFGASFGGMKVRGNADFTDAEFVGSVDFSRADIANDFDGEGAKFGGASFYGMKVGGGTSFHSAVFEGPVDFRYADFGRLDLAADLSPQATAKFRKEYPDTPSQFDMQGMSYKYVGARIGNEPESHKALLTLADQSLYTADVYSNLA